MKHLIIGAGATLAEALALGNEPSFCPPLISDFARKMWQNYTPHPVLEAYLSELGYTGIGDDARLLFFQLEDEGVTNIERFLEYAWINRNREWRIDEKKIPPGFISGLRLMEATSNALELSSSSDRGFWPDLLYHGIGMPLNFFLHQCFWVNGQGWKQFNLSSKIIQHLTPLDLVLNLNYDTVFELAIKQCALDFVYSPGVPNSNQIMVCKPHGSLNMIANDHRFAFADPEWLGSPQPQGFSSYSGIIPPILNKEYSSHPIAEIILASVVHRNPNELIFWGVGLTESDAGLSSVYRSWGEDAKCITVINPSSDVASRARSFFGKKVSHFISVEEWEKNSI